MLRSVLPILYNGKRVTISSPDDPCDPAIIISGFVELFVGGQFLGILKQGNVVGFEQALYSRCKIEYRSVGKVSLGVYEESDLRSRMALTSTVVNLVEWARIPRLPVEERIKAVILYLSKDDALRISTAELSRICGFTRPTVTYALQRLQRQEWLYKHEQDIFIGRHDKKKNNKNTKRFKSNIKGTPYVFAVKV